MALGRRKESVEVAEPQEGALVAVGAAAAENGATGTPIGEQPEPDTTHGMSLGADAELPLELPESDTKEAMFKHRAVRAILCQPRIEKAKSAEETESGKADWWYRPGKDTYALVCNFMLRGDQPDHPELEDLRGFRLSFNRFIIAQGMRGQETYLAIFKAYGLNPRAPWSEVTKLEDRAVILSLRSTQGEDGRVYHNVNKVLRDVDYENAHGGADAA